MNPHYRRAYGWPCRRVPVTLFENPRAKKLHMVRHRGVCACQVPACSPIDENDHAESDTSQKGHLKLAPPDQP